MSSLGATEVREARPDDRAGVLSLCARIHGESDADAAAYLWDKLGPEAWTVSVADGEVVSSMVGMRPRLEIDGLDVPCTQIEYVATDPLHRRRGLVRLQLDIHRRRAAERGDLVLLVAGVPEVYKRLGFAYALDFAPRFLLCPPEGYSAPPDSPLVRPAERYDVEVVRSLHDLSRATATVRIVPDPDDWAAMVSGRPKWRHVYVAEAAGRVLGWMRLERAGESLEIVAARALTLAAAESLVAHALRVAESRTVAALAGSWDAFGAFVKHHGHRTRGATPMSAAVPDPVALVQRIVPVLERRLSSSCLRHERGDLYVDWYTGSLRIGYRDGRITKVAPVEALEFEDTATVRMPPDLLAGFILGWREPRELESLDPGVSFAGNLPLVEVLFPAAETDLVGVL
ncbi:MAG: hypothetical protein KatS3mg008_0099 [Acidimicrobiales bacterium]|nr:MAG: hypothetical protein KatS3mg008_0099 [Acidimicrobiales bacterium]